MFTHYYCVNLNCCLLSTYKYVCDTHIVKLRLFCYESSVLRVTICKLPTLTSIFDVKLNRILSGNMSDSTMSSPTYNGIDFGTTNVVVASIMSPDKNDPPFVAPETCISMNFEAKCVLSLDQFSYSELSATFNSELSATFNKRIRYIFT